MNSIGELISQKRKENRITQKQLADLLHLTPSAISKWENDVAVPHISQFPQIAEVLQIPVAELYALTIDDFRYTAPTTVAENESESNMETAQNDTDIDSTMSKSTPFTASKSKKHSVLRLFVVILLTIAIAIAVIFVFGAENSKEPVFEVVDEYFSSEMPYFNHTDVYYVIIEYKGKLTDEYLQAYEPKLRKMYEEKFQQATVILIQFYDRYDGFDSNSSPDMKLALLPTARN